MSPSPENIWSILPASLDALSAASSVMDGRSPATGGFWEDYCTTAAEEKNGTLFDSRSGLLVVRAGGVLLRGADAECEAFYGLYNSERLDAAARFALEDPRVRSIAILWDSPGGYISGMSGTLAAFAALRAARPGVPVRSLAVGLCCSLAYVFASAFGEIHGCPGAVIGSIGVMWVTTDSSAAYKNWGLDVRLFADGKFKGMGTPGIPWSPEWYGAVEERIAQISGELRASITSQRPGVTVEDMQGQTWEIEEAPAALYDSIHPGDPDDWLNEQAAALSSSAL